MGTGSRRREIDVALMHHVLHGALIDQDRRDRIGERIREAAVELLRRDRKGAGNARARRQHVADHGNGAVARLLEQQSRPVLAQLEDSAQFEPQIDPALDAMKLSRPPQARR